mgnify:CR=1 FL=1
MHEVVNVGAFFYETSTKKLSLTRMQVYQEVKHDNDKIISFMRPLVLRVIESRHNFIHQPVDGDELEDGT